MKKIPLIFKLTTEELIDLAEFLEAEEELIGDGVDMYGALSPIFEQIHGREPEPSYEDECTSTASIENWVTGFKVGYMMNYPASDITDEKLDYLARKYYSERLF